jgi:hypothetical protein
MDNHLLPMGEFFHLQFKIEMLGFAPMETINSNTLEGYNISFFMSFYLIVNGPCFYFIPFTGTDIET